MPTGHSLVCFLVGAACALSVAAVLEPRAEVPAPTFIGGLTSGQHQMLVEVHCYVQGGEWGPMHGCTLVEVRP